jgi:hypothetical protein
VARALGGRKETVTHPHRQIRQGQLADGHDVIFAVIQFIHDAFVSGQLFQRPQKFPLLTSVPLVLGALLVAFCLNAIHPLPIGLQLCIHVGLLFPAFNPVVPLGDALGF